jgi:hypothetical protein
LSIVHGYTAVGTQLEHQGMVSEIILERIQLRMICVISYYCIHRQMSIKSTTHSISLILAYTYCQNILHITFPPAASKAKFSIVQLLILKHLLELHDGRPCNLACIQTFNFASRHFRIFYGKFKSICTQGIRVRVQLLRNKLRMMAFSESNACV